MPSQPNLSTLPSFTARGPFVTVIIPAYKEEEHIAQAITDTIAELRRNRFDFEVLIVLDSVPGDRTGSIIHELCHRYAELRLVERVGKRGVGDAIRTGVGKAEGGILAIVMGDHTESPRDLVKLVNAVAQGYDMAIGDRFKHGKPYGYPLMKYIANRCCNFLIRAVFSIPSSDTTNAFKAYNTLALKEFDISSRDFEVFAEIPLKVHLRRRNAKIANIPVQHSVRKKSAPKLSLAREGPRYIRLVSSLFIHRR